MSCLALVDSGASLSVVSRRFAEHLAVDILPAPRNFSMSAVNSDTLSVYCTQFYRHWSFVIRCYSWFWFRYWRWFLNRRRTPCTTCTQLISCLCIVQFTYRYYVHVARATVQWTTTTSRFAHFRISRIVRQWVIAIITLWIFGPLGLAFGKYHSILSATLSRIRSSFLQSMGNQVRRFVLSCEPCCKAKAQSIRTRAPLSPIETTSPFEIVGCDILDLPETSNGFNAVLVVTDLFTKWCEAYPLRQSTAEEVSIWRSPRQEDEYSIACIGQLTIGEHSFSWRGVHPCLLISPPSSQDTAKFP